MAKVYLYEDRGGSLYLHLHDSETVYANVDIMVPYGATFSQDASEIADGRPITSDSVLKMSYSEFETLLIDQPIRRIASWEDGKLQRYAHPGRDGALYLEASREINPEFDRVSPS